MVSTKFHTLFKRHWISWSFWKKWESCRFTSLPPPHTKKTKDGMKRSFSNVPSNEIAFKRDCLQKRCLQKRYPSTFQTKTIISSHPHPPSLTYISLLISWLSPPPNLWAAKVKDVKGDSATCNTKELSKAARPRCRPRWQSNHPTIPSHSLLFLTGET